MRRSQDYYEHISRVRRAPSEITGVPRYPSAHVAFGKKAPYGEDEGRQNYGERVEVADYERSTNPENMAGGSTYEDVYSKKNRGGFELHPWKTFRP